MVQQVVKAVHCWLIARVQGAKLTAKVKMWDEKLQVEEMAPHQEFMAPSLSHNESQSNGLAGAGNPS
jgi:hypothetical protein